MLKPEDIKVETYPPIPNGLHHNGPRPGIIIHHKSGVSVACTSERSQHHNKKKCLTLIEYHLYLSGETDAR